MVTSSRQVKLEGYQVSSSPAIQSVPTDPFRWQMVLRVISRSSSELLSSSASGLLGDNGDTAKRAEGC